MATDHPTREALLEAGLQLAETQPLAQISINEIVTTAGKAKGTFYVHFGDRTDYLVALHQRFHERLKTAVLESIQGFEPGAARLQQGSLAYLNRCLVARGVKVLLLEARGEPAIGAEVQGRNREFARLAEADFTAMNWQPAAECAYLYITMVAEAALLEVQSGQVEPTVRQALARFLFAE